MIRNRPNAGLTIALSLLTHVGLASLGLHRARAVAHPSVLSGAPLETSFEVEAPDLLPPAHSAPPEPTAAPVLARPVAAARANVPPAASVPAPSVASTESSALPATPVFSAESARFAIVAAPVTGREVSLLSAATSAGSHAGAAAGAGSRAGTNAATEPSTEGAVDTPARLLRGAPPVYPAAAQSAGVQADVPIEIVVDPSGAVQSARSLAHVGYGLDEAALRAVRSYRFRPAVRGGKTVAIRMRWLMRFQLG